MIDNDRKIVQARFVLLPSPWRELEREVIKEKLIAVVNVECDDKNYKMYKSATQEKFHGSNADGFIKTTKSRTIINETEDQNKICHFFFCINCPGFNTTGKCPGYCSIHRINIGECGLPQWAIGTCSWYTQYTSIQSKQGTS